MRRTFLLLASVVIAALSASGIAPALPSESPDATPMVDGRVRAFAKVGANVWVGGNFSRVEHRDGAVTEDVGNAAVFDSVTGRYLDIAPQLGGEGSTVYDMAVYGDDVLVAGTFPGPSGTQKNLVALDGKTGAVVRWYNAPPLQSVLAAPQLGRVYGGGEGLSAFDFAGGERLWSRAQASADPGLRPNANRPGYRDLELDGPTIWAACVCDSVQGPDGAANPAKALVKLDAEGNHDPSWVAEAEPEAFGISVESHEGSVYLGAGGSDFLASYPGDGDGRRAWVRDTSGSVQVVERMGGRLVVGGHFWEVADGAGDACGHRSGDNDQTLDPSHPDGPHYPNPDPDRPDDRCATRHGLAAYSFSGELDPGWAPMLGGKYNLAWALRPEAATGRLHVGGEFTEVDGARQTFYATLPPVTLP